MILLTLGQTADELVVTLNETRTLTSGYYLFSFTHVTTRDVVSIIYNFLDDDSAHQDRYNLFEINTNTIFSNKPTGHWTYEVYEQASSSNTDVTGLTMVEQGIMQLKPETEFAWTEAENDTSFKQYNG